jgi:hypothetical protein
MNSTSTSRLRAIDIDSATLVFYQCGWGLVAMAGSSAFGLSEKGRVTCV